MTVINVPDDWYGPGTSKMRDICIRAEGIAWFNIAFDESAAARLEGLVMKHFRLLRPIDREPKKGISPNLKRG
jgi:hypothetical protein